MVLLSAGIARGQLVRVIDDEPTGECYVVCQRYAVKESDPRYSGRRSWQRRAEWLVSDLKRRDRHGPGGRNKHDVLSREQRNRLRPISEYGFNLRVRKISQHPVIVNIFDYCGTDDPSARLFHQLRNLRLGFYAAYRLDAEPQLNLNALASGGANDRDFLLPVVHETGLADAIHRTPAAYRSQLREDVSQRV